MLKFQTEYLNFQCSSSALQRGTANVRILTKRVVLFRCCFMFIRHKSYHFFSSKLQVYNHILITKGPNVQFCFFRIFFSTFQRTSGWNFSVNSDKRRTSGKLLRRSPVVSALALSVWYGCERPLSVPQRCIQATEGLPGVGNCSFFCSQSNHA